MATEPKLIETEETSESSALAIFLEPLKRQVAVLQDYTYLAARTIANWFTPPHYVNDLLQQMDIIGIGSMPIVLLTGAFIGAVMVLQTGSQFERFGETSLTGDVVSLALVRELGPTITGLLVAGRNASGMASELGSMLVTEQVDAMRAMGTDPNRKLVAPRVLATICVLPLLTAMADLIGLTGGFIVSYFTLRIGAVEFWTRALNALEFSDLMQGMAKPIVFAFLLATIGCYKGLTVRGGTQGVGRATTQAVVVSSVSILVTDFFLTKFALFLAGRTF
jgi:phospholipid/cholesterol/gamma-HCH transport system permease protein